MAAAFLRNGQPIVAPAGVDTAFRFAKGSRKRRGQRKAVKLHAATRLIAQLNRAETLHVVGIVFDRIHRQQPSIDPERVAQTVLGFGKKETGCR